MTSFTDWQTFDQIVGSAAAALTGLQFVAMALIVDVPRRSTEQGVEAFTDPTIVHFIVALLLAATEAMPWRGVGPAGSLWGLLGFGGVVFITVNVFRMRRQKAYQPIFEDWLFHAGLPLIAYAVLAGAGFGARGHLRGALFGVAATSLLLLVIGIHNSWDNLTYMVQMRRQRKAGEDGNGVGEAPQ